MPIKRDLKDQPLPITREEMLEFGWDEIDIVLVTGDAYIDHPSFGIAIIGRWLYHHGYRVAVLPQPFHHNYVDFTRFGRPKLFFGISSGNLDSIVANYSGNSRVRDFDSYSPNGNPYFGDIRDKKYRIRPDRATIRYTQLAKEAYPDVPVILGGLEASLRRFVHYDYQQEKIRPSILEDSKADLLVYGMGERQVLEIARQLENDKGISGIYGTCELLGESIPNGLENNVDNLILPSYDEILNDKTKFLLAEMIVEENARKVNPKVIYQRQKKRYVKQNPPPPPLTQKEIDEIYNLSYTYLPHPIHREIPAWNMIKNSITIVRGCVGNCSFCSISRHQGNFIQSRGVDSVMNELEKIKKLPYFKGTINDVGGPTANLYGATCKKGFACNRRDCLNPEICKNLVFNPDDFIYLLDKIRKSSGLNHLFVSSGLRYDLLLHSPNLLEKLILYHTPGRLKIAPESLSDNVLRLMHKVHSGVFHDFMKLVKDISQATGEKTPVLPYYISSHPGCTERDMEITASDSLKLKIKFCSLQDFTPTPGTISTAMYYSCIDWYYKKDIFVAKKRGDRVKQRLIMEKKLKIV